MFLVEINQPNYSSQLYSFASDGFSYVEVITCHHDLVDHYGISVSLLTFPEHLSSPPVFSGGSCYSIISFICICCRSLFVLLYFFFWPLCCLFFFDIQILITPLERPGGSISQIVGLPYNSYKPITNTAWVRTRLCKLQKRVHSTHSHK